MSIYHLFVISSLKFLCFLCWFLRHLYLLILSSRNLIHNSCDADTFWRCALIEGWIKTKELRVEAEAKHSQNNTKHSKTFESVWKKKFYIFYVALDIGNVNFLQHDLHFADNFLWLPDTLSRKLRALNLIAKVRCMSQRSFAEFLNIFSVILMFSLSIAPPNVSTRGIAIFSSYRDLLDLLLKQMGHERSLWISTSIKILGDALQAVLITKCKNFKAETVISVAFKI